MRISAVIIVTLAAAGCRPASLPSTESTLSGQSASAESTPKTGLGRALQSLRRQMEQTKSYDPSYVDIPCPGGDVPMDRGVCSDVVVRALRAAGVDLQEEVHEDMSRAFSAYPALWGLRRPDSNIDHRRVANLMAYFRRRGFAVPASSKASDYLPGDVVAWELPGGRLHIGMVAESAGGGRPHIVHNIGSGAKSEDVLFAWKIIGHYRCF